MVFLFSLLVVEYLALVQVLRAPSLIRSEALPPRVAWVTAASMMFGAMLASMPLLLEFSQAARMENGESISLTSNSYLDLALLGIGGLLAIGSFGYRIYFQRRKPAAGFWSVGANAMGLLVGTYFVFVVADQLAFFAPPRDDAGVVSWGYFSSLGTVKDVQCDRDVLIVKGINSGLATYRCPRGIVLARFSSMPIAPWPAYSEGESAQLAAAVKKLHAEAVKQ
ncbi:MULTISPECIES: hypothetical protein [Ralstonia]|uniref:Uncharacterized protein n=2 Tax=Ralstonia TaxID=48736 RepID=A0AAD2BT01_9RALS|nr:MULTISPECIES: hypothetical protein [Ralstonia]NMV39942.1 hypothetical protein [Ralstonia insidiosa]CAJ0807647.1 hypothetical protein R77560_04605 [Ralstonia sp. LMG 18095]